MGFRDEYRRNEMSLTFCEGGSCSRFIDRSLGGYFTRVLSIFTRRVANRGEGQRGKALSISRGSGTQVHP